MGDETTPDLLDLMAEALTATFKGHPQRRHQALAANRVLAERMWPPVQAALDQRDASLAESRTARDSLRNRIRELEQAVCAGCMTREQQRDSAIEASRLNGVKAEEAKAAWYREKDRAEKAEAEREEYRNRFGAQMEAATELVAELTAAEAERDQHGWRIARVRAVAQVWIDIRPDYPTATRDGHTIAWAGQQIIAALDQPREIPARLKLREPSETELAAVREWAAKFDPRQETT